MKTNPFFASLNLFTLSILLGLQGTEATAHAQTIAWTDWTSAVSGSSVHAGGTISVPGNAPLTVTYAGEIYFAQTNNVGTYYWNPTSTFTSASVTNTPTTSDIITLEGGLTAVDTLTFSQSVHNPVMNILSLGNPSDPITYNFNAPFTVLSNGPSVSYGGPGTLNQLPGNILQGIEGDGTIEFMGDYTSISWTVPSLETFHGFIGWQGFTVGIAGLTTNAVPEPGAVALILAGSLTGTGLLWRKRRGQAR